MVFSPNKSTANGSSIEGGDGGGRAGLLKVHISPPPSNSPTITTITSGCSPSLCSIGSMMSGGTSNGLMTPSTAGGPQSGAPASPRIIKEEWISLEGPLYMKCISGAFSLLQSRKRCYFGLEEIENRLIFYRTKADFDGRKDCLGQIPMNGAFCSLDEANFKAFYLHTDGGKKYFFEAENERAADCWLNALQQRREECAALNGEMHEMGGGGPLLMQNNRRHRSRSKSVGHSDSDSELLTMKGAGLERQRARSHYHQQKCYLDPIRLLDAATGHNHHYQMNGGSPTLLESSIASSSPSTPLSMLPGEFSSVNNGGLSRRKYSRVSTTRKASSTAMISKVGMESPTRRRTNRGEPILMDCCCICGVIGSGQQWVLDSWLKDQHHHSNEMMKYNHQMDPRSLTIEQSGAEIGGSGICTGTASEGGEGDFDSSGGGPLLLNGATPVECQSTMSSETCESAGALAAKDQEGRDDELIMLRKMCNRQKELILELKTELERERAKKIGTTFNGHLKGHTNDGANECQIIQEDHTAAFLAKSRFLNAELVRVNERKQEADKQIDSFKKKIGQLEAEMEEFKKEYIHSLQSCVRIPLRENSACDVVQVKLYGGDEHERKVKKLLEKARESEPTLPTFESVIGQGTFHVDEYGFRHNFEEIPLALHFIATQLHQHYQSQSAEYVHLKAKWRALLESQPDRIERNRETRQLCRLGIPRSLRSKVWRLLIGQQVADLKAKYGPYYYRDLCSSQGTPVEKHYNSTHQKQVNLDLLRTMPGNVHFMSASCKGVTHLQTVLRAYCLHNPRNGYCQGMNFLVATALLFMSPEDAFWFLVAITERYFDSSYFDQSLTGAQADQEVLKEIVEQKFPRLAQHLDECEIDLTTVTLNWFIALFFDALPFQTMLRIWDCFLMEGPKVLFRFTIALLGLYEEDILAHSDTISVIKVLKAGVRLALDVDGLMKYAFEDLNPFPSKTYLRQRQSLYLQVIQERLQKRLQLRQFLNASDSYAQSDQLCDLPIEVIVFSPFVQDRAYVCAGNQKRGKIAMIQLHEEAVNLNIMDLEFDCRPVSMVIFQPEMAFVSLLSGYILAVHLRPSGQAEILWELKLNDVALKLVHCSSRLYSCLANGTLAVLENAFERMPSALDLYHIPVAAAPISDALLDDEYLYLAVACKVIVLNRQTLSTVSTVYVASAAAGSQVPMFEKIRVLSMSPHGIWLVTAHSSLLQLWRNEQCEMLFDIRYDHSHRKPSFDEQDDLMDQVEVCSILFHADELWVGTVDGYLMLYRFHLSNSVGGISAAAKCRQIDVKYQPGKRLSPAHGLAQPIPTNRQQTYYIPTESEKQMEERNHSMECMMEGPERQASRKISVKIDPNSRKYSVNVSTLRHPSIDSGTTTMSATSIHSLASILPNGNVPPKADPIRPVSKSLLNPSATALSPVEECCKQKRQLCAQQSVDSAFSSLFAESNPTANPPIQSQQIQQPTNDDELFLCAVATSAGEDEEEDENENVEEEEEDEEEVKMRERCGAAEQQQWQRFPSKLVRINSWRRMASVATSQPTNAISKPMPIGPRSSSFSSHKLSFNNSSSQTTTTSSSYAGESAVAEEIRIRRKDLDFEEPLLLAVKKGESLSPSLGASPPAGQSSMTKLAKKTTTRATTIQFVPNGGIGATKLVEMKTTEIKDSLGMGLQMKLKVADKPVRCIALGHFGQHDVILTGAGDYGDEEAMLRWRRDPNNCLWINDPLVDIGVQGRKRTGLTSPTRKII